MPVPSAMEHKIRIQRDANSSSALATTPQQLFQSNPSSNSAAQQQQETRTWRQETFSTKRVVQGSTEPAVTQQQQHHTTSSSTNKSQDLFSNKHSNEDRRNSSTSTTSTTTANNNNTSMKSSSLVSKALQEFEDDFQNQVQDLRRNSKTVTSTQQSSVSNSLLPVSTPTMEIVPSGGGRPGSPSWSMGTDAQGDVPLTYEIVSKADGSKEFQLLLTARDFSPEDLQVKLVDNTLTITGNHEETQPNGAYKQKSFSRTCTIPSGVRPEDLNCSLDSCGRLKVTAPVPDLERSINSNSSALQQQVQKVKNVSSTQSNNWHENGVLSTGIDNMKLGGGNEFGNNNNERSQSHTTKTVTKTVKTFKSVA